MSPIWFWPKKTICGCNCSYYLRFFFFLLKDTLAVSGIKPLTYQLQESRPISNHKPTLLSQFLSTMSETGKCQQKGVNPLFTWRHGNPSGCGCSGWAALPLLELNHTAVTKPADWRTVIWTRNAGDEMRGQTKLVHQREESTLQAISCSSLQWIGSPTGRLLGSERASHISQMGQTGERGDPPMSLELQMTKN